ncbi:unnamed protein product [Durusdinium trenchii]|uniref:Ammonium transporter AmtB-like domain-containing protein n=1 Tax=Durusdinium trenchii TaxID=1381693 RepID=A0ABP0HRJ2_9DINO
MADLDALNGDHADDATWVLTSSFVILTMQSGFGMLEMGSSSKGHEVNIVLKNIFDVVCGALAYYCVGYGISYGSPSNPFMGTGDYFIDTSDEDRIGFAATSTTIVSGCLAMRCRLIVYCIFSFYAVIVYSFVAHWIWEENGWLRAIGVHDFAGSGAVSLLGAMNGLLGILFIGPRLGRFDAQRPRTDFEPSSPPTVLFGLFMLWWGWIGFNCGSSFGITKSKWLVVIYRSAETLTINSKIFAICLASPLLKLHIDDPVGAVGVHGASAVWGLLAVGLFADGELPGIDVENGLFRGGGPHLLGVQLLCALCILAWSALAVTPFFYLTGIAFSRDCRDPRRGLRFDPEDEVAGIDGAEHSRKFDQKSFDDVESVDSRASRETE